MGVNPFDYVTSITASKKNLLVDDLSEKNYNPFIVNRALSYFQDTILIANEMNINHHIDNKLQYDFLLKIVRKGKRFTKWYKPEKIEAIELIKEKYHYSDEKARAVLDLFDEKQLQALSENLTKGGRKA